MRRESSTPGEHRSTVTARGPVPVVDVTKRGLDDALSEIEGRSGIQLVSGGRTEAKEQGLLSSGQVSHLALSFHPDRMIWLAGDGAYDCGLTSR